MVDAMADAHEVEEEYNVTLSLHKRKIRCNRSCRSHDAYKQLDEQYFINSFTEDAVSGYQKHV